MFDHNKQINLLFLSAGRRVNLLKAFRNSLKELGYSGNVIAADMKPTAPALYVSDKSYLVPKLNSPDFIECLERICISDKVTAVIPLIDPDLLFLAACRERIEKTGAKVLVSTNKVVEICNDKEKTGEFFTYIDVLTPKLYTLEEAVKEIEKGKTLFIKPKDGSSSKNTFKINSLKELDFFYDYVPNSIIQEYIEGVEYTVDVFSDFAGNAISIVPRIRLETRAGESSKGKAVQNAELTEISKKVVELLGIIGPSTLQAIKSYNGKFYFIEINPRFGGGVLFSIKVGADSTKNLLQLLNNVELLPEIGNYKENVIMMRYDDEILINEEQLVGSVVKND